MINGEWCTSHYNGNKKGEKQIINLKIIEAKKHITFSLNGLFDAGYSKKVIKKKVVNKLVGPKESIDPPVFNLRKIGTFEQEYGKKIPFDGVDPLKEHYYTRLGEYELAKKKYDEEFHKYLLSSPSRLIVSRQDKNLESEPEFEVIEKQLSMNDLKKKYPYNRLSEGYSPTDFDIALQIKTVEDGKDVGKNVATSEAPSSNVEFIRFKTKDAGEYRIVITQVEDTRGEQATVGASSYVIY